MRATRRGMLFGAVAAAVPAPVLAAKAPAGRALRLAHLTDVHVMPERDAALGMEKALQAAQAHQPDLLLMGGDLIMDALAADRARVKAQWDIYSRVLNANAALPIEACLGNHDVWGWEDIAKFGGERGFGKRLALDVLRLERSYRSFDRAGWHFIVLDSTHRVEGNGYTAKLDDEQFEWLSDDLKRTPKQQPILVLSHIPILSACAHFDGENEKSGDWKIPGGWMHIDARRIKDLFRQHPNIKLCLSGHIHLVDRVEYLGVTYLCNGAVCGAWWRGRNQEFGNGYAVVDLFRDGSFQSQFVEFPWAAKAD